MGLFSAKVAAKYQIVIPKKIREKLDVSIGDTINFLIQGDIVTLQKRLSVCPACLGTSMLNDMDCFVCSGEGSINPNSHFYEEIQKLDQYKISVNITSHSASGILPFPKIHLHSIEYAIEIIEWYQDYLQAKAIETFVNKNEVQSEDFDVYSIVNSFTGKESRTVVISYLPSIKGIGEVLINLGIKNKLHD